MAVNYNSLLLRIGHADDLQSDLSWDVTARHGDSLVWPGVHPRGTNDQQEFHTSFGFFSHGNFFILLSMAGVQSMQFLASDHSWFHGHSPSRLSSRF